MKRKTKIFKIIKLLRPRQWIKNFAVFAAIVFNGELFNLFILEKVIISFVVFCLLSSAIYIINDFFDIEKDRLHPFKKFMPLANKDVSIPLALSLAAILIAASFAVGFYVTPMFFFLMI